MIEMKIKRCRKCNRMSLGLGASVQLCESCFVKIATEWTQKSTNGIKLKDYIEASLMTDKLMGEGSK